METNKKIRTIISMLLIIALLMPAVLMPHTANAAQSKITVKPFSFKLPSNWIKYQEENKDGSTGLIYLSDDGENALTVQVTRYKGQKPDIKSYKPFYDEGLKNNYGDRLEKLKYSYKNTNLGKALVATFIIREDYGTVSHHVYTICKGEYMINICTIDTNKKFDNKILKSLKFKK